MARYIDAEKLEELCDMMKKEGDSFSEVLWNQFKILVQWQPCADVKKVVRCKNCKWWGLSEYNIAGIQICKKFSGVRGESDFCSRAERREE